MAARPKLCLTLLIALAIALGGSLIGNYFLFNKAIDFYTREAAIRIDPIDLKRYAQENAEVSSREKQKPRIIVFGESRANMWRTAIPENWGDVEIINRGIGGETTPQIKARLRSDVLALDPDLVIMQMGDNDLKAMAMMPERKSEIEQQTYQNILQIARAIRNSGAEALITTIFPPAPIELLRTPLWSDEVNPAIDALNERLLALDEPAITVVDCDVFLRQGDYIKPEFAIDTLHMKPVGYQALNEGLEETVKGLLAK
ncbi:GDSL-type esterase/lipase family protein [Pelagicoccus sp. SDUM812003]|uniref:SGNH/GDSL hydrolase family protein n=1 Tax=Pelagicoccus sp. SDUM812003 TaxID=3041267 RepID=UPI002810328B|nr:GDSL-type esterase/lipase family protein [Pelagicoccus sp. SDUM812003]MDQ8203249.1 GDSL-type esterase/lipase family protein [Pelagicoccus sp. SDUM812003]